jgi:hypothetical protein
MKKILAVSILLTFVVSSGAFAASARWGALGNEHRFTIDTTNYTIYPGRMHQFTNALWIIPKSDFGDNSVSSGVLVSVADNMSFSYNFNLLTPGATRLGTTLQGLKSDRLKALTLRPFPDILWCMKQGNMNIGAEVALAMDSSAVKTEGAEDITTSATAADLKLGMTMYKSPVGDLDLGLRVGKQMFADDNPNDDPKSDPNVPPNPTKIESTGGLDLALDARLIRPMGKELMDKEKKPIGREYSLISFLNLNMVSNPAAKWDKESALDVSEVSSISGDVGCGFHKNIPEKGTVIAGAVFGGGSTKTKATTTVQKPAEEGKVELESKDLPETTNTSLNATILAGYEFPIAKWLIGRGGVNVKFSADTIEKVAQKKETDEAGKETVKDVVDSTKALGVGYYYNMGFRSIYRGAIIDVIFARDIIHRGPYFLTGAAKDWATNVCLTYKF